MNNLVETISGVAVAIVGVALLAVLVSKNAQTPQVISAAGTAFSSALNAATGPVSGVAGLGGTSLGNETLGPGYI
jgi:hypothetical protein